MIPVRLWDEIDAATGELREWAHGDHAFTDAPTRLAASLHELRHEYGRSVRDHEHDLRRADALMRCEEPPDRPVRSFVESGRFEAAFRGSVDEVAARYSDVADRLAAHGPVVDIGAGRGEFLNLLAARGVAARGCELDRALARMAVAIGHDVSHADGGDYLRAISDAAIGAVVALQVIEHLGVEVLRTFVTEAARVVRRGGMVFVDTPNPLVASTFTNAFYADPTHTVPVHPDWLVAEFRAAGFATVTVEWREPDQPLGDQSPLSNFLFGPNDYAIVAVR